MIVKIRGKSKSPRGMTRKEFKYATWWFATTLMGPRLANNIDFDVVVESGKGHADGYCGVIDPLDSDPRKPRMFELIVSDKYSRAKQLKILAHEMVHAKQYARGELQYFGLRTARWNGKDVKLGNTIEDYINYPWEIEAFGREHGLYFMYQSYVMSKNLKFK
jgi:hypothetical protein